ncbi:MAG: indolepyruvate oxidoreductase subunit beta [Deltaproteobacteria bacterium HGW-Deltaproteobacteria-12]|jgi:indolepyruvate ferredoxin oxidoreductase beta subunit|nr:MAG: indolepyruvate oxidoreductase subunit beta [Deltaproteobacteria bacterium HGW-Deltaproteobacteria-12]
MMNSDVRSILLAGVGGQGILRASDIMCMALMEAGLDVKKSEVHGMAQRGGCVTSHVRYGEKVYSPLAKLGSIDLLVAFEKMESLRYLNYLTKEATIIVNTEEIYPPAVNSGDVPYPEDSVAFLKSHYKQVKEIDATALAIEAGNIKAANVVLLGAISNLMDIPLNIWQEVIKKAFSDKLVQMNLTAFLKGRAN